MYPPSYSKLIIIADGAVLYCNPMESSFDIAAVYDSFPRPALID